MNWPGHLAYIDALQHPALCFQDPELQQAAVESVDRFGLPRPASGNFACVFKLHTGGRVCALKLFTRKVADRRERYIKLHDFLADREVTPLVSFEYLPEAIRIGSEWYPALKMDWVEGCTLSAYVRDHLNEPDPLRDLAARCEAMLRELHRHGIAHGDLQHGNILVDETGNPRLVDYDAMFARPLAGGTSPELGHPNWQHPGRRQADFHPRLDNFSGVVIVLSLRALAADPGLWERFHRDDALILHASDYRSPDESPVFAALTKSSDRKVRALAEALQRDCRRTESAVGPPWNLPAGNVMTVFRGGIQRIGIFVALMLVVAYLFHHLQPAGPSTPPVSPVYWTNSLGMPFVKLPGHHTYMCRWETRVWDFHQFVQATGYQDADNIRSLTDQGWQSLGRGWLNPSFSQTWTNPVVGIHWSDALKFCDWLTQREQTARHIRPDYRYRLPRRDEWNTAVGPGAYPWGDEFPPPATAGNYADTDPHPRTSPVGSFPANRLGIHDLGGNVQEWVGDQGYTLRGGSWYHRDERYLRSDSENTGADALRNETRGFRVVLAYEPRSQ